MPALDRRITVRRTMQTVNQFGESTETEKDYTAWATRVDRSQMDKAERAARLRFCGVTTSSATAPRLRRRSLPS